MSEQMMNHPTDDLTLEEGLKLILTCQPEPAFAKRLEQRLLEQQPVTSGQQTHKRRPSFTERWRVLWAQVVGATPRLRWATLSLVLLLILIAGLFVIGPQRVWAGLQAWLGYVPGVGFVDLEASRLLMNPERVTREGITLQVEQVLASPDETMVVLDSEGLPPQEQLWPDGPPLRAEFRALLRLPDGETLAPTSLTTRIGWASLIFPPLPPDVYRVSLELSRLPQVPSEAAPENWVVPLLLSPASGEVVAEMYPQPYRPLEAVESHQGVTLRVVEVAHHAQETAVQMQLDWQNPEWKNFFGPSGFREPYLRDGKGNKYNLLPSSTTGSQIVQEVQSTDPDAPAPPANRWIGSDTFEPVPPTVEELTLVVDGVDFDIPASGNFTVDLGQNPQVGDRWELDVTLDVAGFPVHITGAELVEEEMRLREGLLRRTVLRFDVEPVPQQENRRLFGIFLYAPGSAFHGGSTDYTSATNKIRTSLELDEGAPIPTGQINVHLRGASLLVRGPWELTWEVQD